MVLFKDTEHYAKYCQSAASVNTQYKTSIPKQNWWNPVAKTLTKPLVSGDTNMTTQELTFMENEENF